MLVYFLVLIASATGYVSDKEKDLFWFMVWPKVEGLVSSASSLLAGRVLRGAGHHVVRHRKQAGLI